MAAVAAQGVNKRKRDAQDIPSIRQATSVGPNASDISSQFLDDMATENAESNIDFGSVTAVIPAHNGPSAATNADRNRSRRPGTDQNPSDTASAALAFTMTIPETTEKQFINQHQSDNSADASSLQTPGHKSGIAPDTDFSRAGVGDDPQSALPTPQTGQKPQVGSDEWHQLRKDNHKEGEIADPVPCERRLTHLPVERRRRETINEGINELAKIVPDCEKNKGIASLSSGIGPS